MLEGFLQGCSIYLPYPALAWLLSMYFTYLLIFILPRIGFVDIPRGRHQHEKPIPRGGGIGIGLSFFITTFLLAVFLKNNNPAGFETAHDFICKFILPAGIILVTGVVDDRWELPSWLKLIFQIAAGVIIYFEGAGVQMIFSWQLPMPLALIITIGWSILIINAFNLIDGLDGIAAGLAAISSQLMAIWTLLIGTSAVTAIILLIFCGCCLGFLRYNFSPAKIFMGDTGSMFIGLFFAYMSMQYFSKSVTMTTLLVPLAAVGVPMFDVMLAIWRRVFRKYIHKIPGTSIMQGDHDHLHHRILKETGTTRKTAFVIYCIALLLLSFAILCTFMEANVPALFFVLMLLVIFVMIRYSGIELFDTLNSVARGIKYPHRNIILTIMHPLVDGVLIFGSFLITRIVCRNFLPAHSHIIWIISHVAPLVLTLCFSRIYRTFWLRVGIIQYYRLIRMLIIAGIGGYILNCIIYVYYFNMPQNKVWHISGFYIIFLLLSMALILAERFIIHYYESFGCRRLFIRNQGKDSTLQRVLIYGGGLRCRIYITSQFCGLSNSQSTSRIIGIIDDDAALKKLNVYGFDVLGSLSDLDEVYSRKQFDAIVVTLEETTGEQLQILRDFCNRRNVELKAFRCNEADLLQ
jgi:UDP-N-acetylmuramyl pentapeptide phosphotransferase/UDP-N-acetylglucosamine-1-phosphate transferase